MKAFLLAAGRGVRFRPVTETLPKPLFPFLNVPLARAHLERLRRQGVTEAGVNLHHLGGQIERDLRQNAGELPKLAFFPEPEILGTAGALRNASSFLGEENFLVVNADAAIAFDPVALLDRHRRTGRAATLLVVENREPERYTPLQAEGDRITGFGGAAGQAPLLYTGVCALSPRLLARIPPGEASLVSELWAPLLAEGREQIGWVLHEGPFADLGSPGDFLRATLESLARGRPFPSGGGSFDPARRVLALEPPRGYEADACTIGRAAIGSGCSLSLCAVWNGVEIGEGARLAGCLVAGGVVAPGSFHENALLWARAGEQAIALPL